MSSPRTSPASATEHAAQHGAKPNVVQVVLAAILEMERSVFFSVLMIIVAYLPLLSLTKIEGLLFRPMAITMVYALIGSLIFALFIVPVLAAVLQRLREWENPLVVKPLYYQLIQVLLALRWLVVAAVVTVFVFTCVRVATKLGIEFAPIRRTRVIYVRVQLPEDRCSRITS